MSISSLFLIACIFLFKKISSESFCEQKYDKAPVEERVIDLLRSDRPFTMTMNKKRYEENIWKGTKLLFYINGTKSGQEFITCVSTKAGSTRIRQLLYRVLNSDYDGVFRDSIYMKKEWVGVYELEPEKLHDLLFERNIPRYLFVRDPYVRAISMYNDKIARQHKDQAMYLNNIGLNSSDTNVSFSQFVETLYLHPSQKLNNINKENPLNLHFVSQSELCGLNLGLKYNYVFKQEDVNFWFDCFVKQINFAEEVMHGWPGEDQCYFSSPKNPCNGPRLKNDGVSTGKGYYRKHDTRSTLQADTFYDNQTMVDMVTELFLQDFINFNYTIM
eukprot:TRINITY_DN2853_c0_g5_i1.p1 TRINITY_DN2853_c0_g5~~TRINITY_DN2853_c0_g5_i1.p1  ORF type:complete len:364 (+),score=31.41 TRINITY_DN2853_c0_g5_i1:105-1094(+)